MATQIMPAGTAIINNHSGVCPQISLGFVRNAFSKSFSFSSEKISRASVRKAIRPVVKCSVQVAEGNATSGNHRSTLLIWNMIAGEEGDIFEVIKLQD